MDEFEKWLEVHETYATEQNDEITADFIRLAIEKFRASKKTCKMMAQPTMEFANYGEWECTNCYERMIRPDGFCTHCGARIEE